MKRQVDAGSVDIKALQTIINDHRTMINYLVNNSINATFVSDAISTHHTQKGPILSSWRDLVDLVFITILIGFIIYFLLCRTRFCPCTTCLSCFSKCLIPNMDEQQKQQQQLQQQLQQQQLLLKQLQEQLRQQEQGQRQQEITKSQSIHRKKQHFPSMPCISDDISHFQNGYFSD
ncbi:unnamed protein product [Rotaria sordida]|uniref:Uncharacterized protein n=1 Tax=Rotaria sordida TaxID=392033 RepID=A0A819KAR4_9BILA|nr:unnamed protein product [Rotaria sordida]CAF3946786.1 unnamed protein product [Rotaria sordida]